MPLNMDSSRAFRSPQEVTRLVQAVLGASPNDESDWIEWKNGFSLRDKRARVEIARHILGMANRLPEDAARHAEGCGYIVIGAEPQRCGGVEEVDPADLDAGLRPYLGSDGPRWGLQYVTPNTPGDSVLVITVEPPRRGDRSSTLQREYDSYRAGTIYIRRSGRTIQAEPGDVRALEDRYAATDHPITLHVRPIGADDSVLVPSIANLVPMLDSWESLRRDESFPPPAPQEPADRGFRIADEFQLATHHDDRTAAEYQDEVDQYIKERREYYLQLAVIRLIERREAKMPLALVNSSDRNYTDICVEIYLSGPVGAGDPADLKDLDGPPSPPRKRGEPKPAPRVLSSWSTGGLIANYNPNSHSTGLNPSAPRLRTFTVKVASESLMIVYDLPRARPEQRVPLDPAVVFSFNPVGTYEFKWTITVGNVDGVVRGAFIATVGEPVNVTEILPELTA
jgi:hypothetical protein